MRLTRAEADDRTRLVSRECNARHLTPSHRYRILEGLPASEDGSRVMCFVIRIESRLEGRDDGSRAGIRQDAAFRMQRVLQRLALQAYFRVNQERMGQFERTLIIIDEGAQAHYIEGCTAPVYSTESFHSGVIEIVVKKNARFRYTTIQNWSNNMYNLVTQRAIVEEGAHMEWLDGNLGSKLTMKYPSCYLMGEGAHGEILSIAYSGDGQHQDTGGKVIHAAPHTTSSIVSKSISKGHGRSTYRGLLKVHEGAHHARSNVECDALLINETSRTDTYPYIEIEENDANVGHEASVSRIGEEQLFYLTSRGIPEDEAMAMIVRGFIEPIAKELPLEYAVELNRLIELEMEGSVG